MRCEPVLGFSRFAGSEKRCFRIARCVFLIGLLVFANFSAHAQDGALPQYRVKSAFLYNFAKFIQWPPQKFASPDAKLRVGVMGDNPFGEYLEELRGKTIGQHEIEIVKVETPEEARKCHVLFIGEKGKKAAKIIEQLERADVLTVTDEMDHFQDVGAVVNLVTTEKHVHFEINVDAARRAELKINSSLLNLAKIVRDGRA